LRRSRLARLEDRESELHKIILDLRSIELKSPHDHKALHFAPIKAKSQMMNIAFHAGAGFWANDGWSNGSVNGN
jgi:hypothetical protein